VQAGGFDIPDDPLQTGSDIYRLIELLYPICRSITGDGFRRTMEILCGSIPLELHEVPSGTKVFDWTVPKEWNIRDAYVSDATGRKIIDFQQTNLHIVNYSVPVNRIMSLEELKPHLFTLPARPDWIPYRTTYYEEDWGFCLRHRDYLELADGDYKVVVDSTLEDGHLTYGELYLPGSEESEILVSCHSCHPSLCNDNLSGVGIATFLAAAIAPAQHRYSYRFLFVPGTIGAITWLALNEGDVSKIKHGLVLAGLGDSGELTYKKSRRGDADIDRAVAHVLEHSGVDYGIVDFDPGGYDERQYCSPGFDLPVGRLSRSPWGAYPEYHTSADDLHFVTPASLGDSLRRILEVFHTLESNRTYASLNPKCEPQLGRRGLYGATGDEQRALMWVLNLSDNQHSLLDMAERSGLAFEAVERAAMRLVTGNLLKKEATG
jgi:aminopeptidase-like protein